MLYQMVIAIIILLSNGNTDKLPADADKLPTDLITNELPAGLKTDYSALPTDLASEDYTMIIKDTSADPNSNDHYIVKGSLVDFNSDGHNNVNDLCDDNNSDNHH